MTRFHSLCAITSIQASTGATTGPTQITHVSLSIAPPPCASVAARLCVARRALAATVAVQARLCCFQCFFWQAFPQYQALWHCEQYIILALSVWQWKQRWVSEGGFFPFPFCLPLPWPWPLLTALLIVCRV